MPPRTLPSTKPLKRRHSPPVRPYRQYRSCLAWEFGFTCAFCLTHDRDLNEHGFPGLGLMWIEHHVPQSVKRERANVYANCFYACLFCNRSRSNAPNISGGKRLLTPCDAAWAAHFAVDDLDLVPLTGDARYTEALYDLNDAARRTMRRKRAEALTEAWAVVHRTPDTIDRLLAECATMPYYARQPLLDAAELLRKSYLQAREQLERFRAVPHGASACRYDESNACTLPQFLERQVVDVRV